MKISLAERITDSFTNSGIIDAQERELYEYGLHHGLLMVVNLITTIIIGIIFGMVWESIVFMLAYIPLRTYAGGYHAKTQFRCYLLSIVLIWAALLGIKLIPWTGFICLMITLCAAAIIFFLAPVEDSNKPLSQVEIKVYGKKARTLLLLEFAILLFMMLIGQLYIASWITMVFVILSIMLILGEIKNKLNS